MCCIGVGNSFHKLYIVVLSALYAVAMLKIKGNLGGYCGDNTTDRLLTVDNQSQRETNVNNHRR